MIYRVINNIKKRAGVRDLISPSVQMVKSMCTCTLNYGASLASVEVPFPIPQYIHYLGLKGEPYPEPRN